MISYVGTSKGGIGRTGRTDESPAALAEKLWKRGYLWLRITGPDGTELGGITLNEGKRIWWAER